MLRHCFLAIGAATLLGCATPQYHLPANAPNARINIKTAQSTWICNGSLPVHSLKADAEGYAIIPAGERLLIGTNYFASGYNVNYSCQPRSSFVPEPGQSYYLDFQIEAERCSALVYKEAPDRPVGLAFEASLAAGGGCPVQ